MASNPLDTKSTAWSALFSEPMSELVQRYTASVGFDRRLWRADIAGSRAHAEHQSADRPVQVRLERRPRRVRGGLIVPGIVDRDVDWAPEGGSVWAAPPRACFDSEASSR